MDTVIALGPVMPGIVAELSCMGIWPLAQVPAAGLPMQKDPRQLSAVTVPHAGPVPTMPAIGDGPAMFIGVEPPMLITLMEGFMQYMPFAVGDGPPMAFIGLTPH